MTWLTMSCLIWIQLFALYSLTILHSERPKLHRVLAVLSAIGLNSQYEKTSTKKKNWNFADANFVSCFLWSFFIFFYLFFFLFLFFGTLRVNCLIRNLYNLQNNVLAFLLGQQKYSESNTQFTTKISLYPSYSIIGPGQLFKASLA